MAAIHDALLRIMGKLDALPKDGTNPEGWKFRSVEALVKKLQPLFLENKVIPTCDVKQIIREEPSRDKKSRTILILQYTLTSAEDGSSITTQCAAEGECLNDKATPKAMTGGWKQAFFQLFMIPVADEDPDASSLGSKPQSESKPQQSNPSAPPKPNDPRRTEAVTYPTKSSAPVQSAGTSPDTIQRGIVVLKNLYANHDDGYHEVTIKGDKSTENPLTLIQRVDKVKSAIDSLPDGDAKNGLLDEFNSLVALTTRNVAIRSEIVSQLTKLNDKSSKAEYDVILLNATEALNLGKISEESYTQIHNLHASQTGSK